jgi:hypothetical protein
MFLYFVLGLFAHRAQQASKAHGPEFHLLKSYASSFSDRIRLADLAKTELQSQNRAEASEVYQP